MGAGTSKPISFEGANVIEIVSIVMGVLAFGGALVAIAFLAKRSGPVGVVALTENAFFSKIIDVVTAFLVCYLPIALLWLGPMLSVLLIKSYFMIPTAGCIVTFFLVGAIEKLLFNPIVASNATDLLYKMTLVKTK